jgi:hypothetical protein
VEAGRLIFGHQIRLRLAEITGLFEGRYRCLSRDAHSGTTLESCGDEPLLVPTRVASLASILPFALAVVTVANPLHLADESPSGQIERNASQAGYAEQKRRWRRSRQYGRCD